MATPRGSTTARGYGGKHQKLRAKLLPHAYGQPCARCGKPMIEGQALDLDHTDDRAGYRGIAHASCNRKAGQLKSARSARRKTSRRTKIITTADRW